MVPPRSDRISRVPPYSRTMEIATHTGLSPLMPDFPDGSASCLQCHWPGPRSLAATSRVSVDVLSYGYLDVSVPRVRFLHLCIQRKIPFDDIWKPFRLVCLRSRAAAYPAGLPAVVDLAKPKGPDPFPSLFLMEKQFSAKHRKRNRASPGQGTPAEHRPEGPLMRERKKLNIKDFPDIKGGFPHSEIRGSKLIRSSPQLIAAYHVLHRLCMPRHPPNALLTLDRSHCQ